MRVKIAAAFGLLLAVIGVATSAAPDLLRWVLTEPSVAASDPSFRNADCPFAFRLPDGARLDTDGIDVTKWPDGSRQIWATWRDDDMEITLACVPKRNHRIPSGFLAAICAPENPNLTEGSYCGPAKRYEGVEVYYGRHMPDAAAAYFWLYTGHKLDGGRLTLRVAHVGGSAPGAGEMERITGAAKSVFETVK